MNSFGRFKLKGLLGEGSTGVVHHAFDEVDKKEVALKILKPEVTARVSWERFRNQFLLVAQLAHPNIAPHLEIGKEGDSAWFTMRLLSGEPLSEVALPVSAELTARYLYEIAVGLEFIHAHGVLHLDLKPSNIFIPQDSQRPLLMDFGLAGTPEGGVCGTPAYLAPEIIRREYFDARADLYSLGVIALELLTGENPFAKSNAGQSLRAQLETTPKIPKLSRELKPLGELIAKLLDKNPQNRPPSAYSVKIALQQIFGFEGEGAEGFFLPKGPFVGRKAELAEIRTAWNSLVSPMVFSIEGEQGVGKTALCERALLDLALEGACVISNSLSENLLAAVLSKFLSEEFKPIFTKYLPPLLQSLEGELPREFIEGLGITAEPPLGNSDSLSEHLAGLFEELTAQRPIAIALRGEADFTVVSAIQRSNSRILLIIEGSGQGQPISLAPLSIEDTSDMLLGLFGRIEGLSPLAREVHERTLGNPSKIRLFALDLVKNGALEPRAEAWLFRCELVPKETPFSDRWDILPQDAKKLITAVAIAGELDLDFLQTLIPYSFPHALFKAVSSGLIAEHQEGTLFTPTLELRENLRSTISVENISSTHIHLAQFAEGMPQTPQRRLFAAQNFEAGEQRLKAAELYFRIGTDALKRLNYPLALSALESADNLLRYLPTDEAKIKSLKRLALAKKYSGDFDSAREAYYRAAAVAESADDAEQRASITGDIGVTFFEQANLEKALEYYKRARDQHKSLGNEKGALIDLVNIAGVHQIAGELGLAREAYLQAIETAKRIENNLCFAAAGLNLAELSLAENDLATALPLALRSAAVAREHHLENILFQALILISRIYRLYSNPKLAMRAVEEAEQMASAAGRRAIALTAIERTAVLRYCGEYDSARASLSRAGELVTYLSEIEREALFIEIALLSSIDGGALPVIKRFKPPELVQALFKVFELIKNEDFVSAETLVDLTLAKSAQINDQLFYEFILQKAKALIGHMQAREALDLLDSTEHRRPVQDKLVLGRLEALRALIYQRLGDLSASRAAFANSRASFAGLENTAEVTRQNELLERIKAPQSVDLGLSKMLPILKALNSTLDSRALLKKILESTLEATTAERALLFIVKNSSAELELGISAEGKDIQIESAKFSHGLVQKVLSTGNAHFAESVSEDSTLSSRESVIDLDLTMALCVPIISEQSGLRGLIYADARVGIGHFDEGTLDFLSALGEQAAIALRNAELFDDLRAERDGMAKEIGQFGEHTIIGKSKIINELRSKMRVVAAEDISLLIIGETGTGKDLFARTIHNESSRREGHFIAINCAAIPENLIESELFGHERGAFTGADKRQIGKFELARGGTIFLDEIGEMPTALQVKLLRVLESRTIQRLGGDEDIVVDIRIIAATNLEIDQALKSGKLRKDLYFRIAPITVEIPPLREHSEDIPLIALHYLDIIANRIARKFESISNSALSALMRYPWPGNVRELIGVIEEAAIFAPTGILRYDDLPQKITKYSPLERSDLSIPTDYSRLKSLKADLAESFEREALQKLLERYNWNITNAAKAFKIGRSRLQQLIKKYDLENR